MEKGTSVHSVFWFWSQGAPLCGYFSMSPGKRWASTTIFVFFFVIGFVYWIDKSVITDANFFRTIATTISPKKSPAHVEFPLNCSNLNLTITCPTIHPGTINKKEESSPVACPAYTRWIHEDLQPWKSTGITRDMVERGRVHANFRLVIVKGKAYVEKYSEAFQTRDVFTIWGILQLLRLYPGKIPDLELMFWCGDSTRIKKRDHQGLKAKSVPPLFHYCNDDESLDIVFPDWTFWGWPELDIKPWRTTLVALKEGNKRIKWKDRKPYAFWKGNPYVSKKREELLKCNVPNKNDWNVRLYIQDWIKESKQGFKNSKLEEQCTHRYKIYIEGWTWSVSEKYILACNSMTLLVNPQYHDFFTRSLVPMQHYWPINITNNICRDLKLAVEWGNNHTDKAQKIGEAGSKFIQENLKMDFVYDYMFHLLSEYAKLLKFEPTIPPGAHEACSETMACLMDDKLWKIKKFMVESMVKTPRDALPCTMPPPL
ncbi:protein O-glucosyltransferase 1-like [Quercus lobata]|nr:protein O-glucosyltransferase 1-like [Quercus lobata]